MIVSESFVIAEWTDRGERPGRPIAAMRAHHRDDEAWFVQEGELGFRVGEREHTLGAGESLLVSRGTPHSHWNPPPSRLAACS